MPHIFWNTTQITFWRLRIILYGNISTVKPPPLPRSSIDHYCMWHYNRGLCMHRTFSMRIIVSKCIPTCVWFIVYWATRVTCCAYTLSQWRNKWHFGLWQGREKRGMRVGIQMQYRARLYWICTALVVVFDIMCKKPIRCT